MNVKLLVCLLSASLIVRAENQCNTRQGIGFNVFVDGLYWQAKEDGFEYAIQNNTGAVRINDGVVRRVDFDWRGGFRVGAGYCTPCGYYQVNAFWTRYHTNGNDCLQLTYPQTLFPVWTNPTSSLTSEQNATAYSKLDLDMFDARVTALFECHDRIDLMPSIGLVFARINQCFNIGMSGGSSIGPVATVLDDAIIMTNNFKGVGPKVGMHSLWNIACGVSLVAQADVALLYGKFNLSQKEIVTFSNNIDPTVFLYIPCNQFNMMRPIVDMMIGLRWDRPHNRDAFCCNTPCHFFVEAGWELNYFFGQNMLMRFSDDVTPGANIELNGDLATQGLMVRVSIRF